MLTMPIIIIFPVHLQEFGDGLQGVRAEQATVMQSNVTNIEWEKKYMNRNDGTGILLARQHRKQTLNSPSSSSGRMDVLTRRIECNKADNAFYHCFIYQKATTIFLASSVVVFFFCHGQTIVLDVNRHPTWCIQSIMDGRNSSFIHSAQCPIQISRPRINAMSRCPGHGPVHADMQHSAADGHERTRRGKKNGRENRDGQCFMRRIASDSVMHVRRRWSGHEKCFSLFVPFRGLFLRWFVFVPFE